jgi:hypothetical protein
MNNFATHYTIARNIGFPGTCAASLSPASLNAEARPRGTGVVWQITFAIEQGDLVTMRFKQVIASALLALLLLAGSGATVAAQTQRGGAAGLVAAVVQASDLIDITDSNVEVVSVDINDSLNNLTALNNILNNSPILSNNDIDVVDVVDVGDIDVDVLNNALNALDLVVTDVIAVAILSGGDLIFLI